MPQKPNFASDANMKTENEPSFSENFLTTKSAPVLVTGNDADIDVSVTVPKGTIVKVVTSVDGELARHNYL